MRILYVRIVQCERDLGGGVVTNVYMTRPKNLNNHDRVSDTSSPRIAEPLAAYHDVLPVVAIRFLVGPHGVAWRRAALAK